MKPIRFFTDEDMHRAVAAQLVAAGFDAVSTPDAARLGEPDESQLAWASQEGRALVTFNVADFARLHHEWLGQNRHHAGIIVSQQRPVGDTIRRLIALSRVLSGDDMKDRLEYLGQWSPP
jgi:hypothetical protein